MSFTSTSRASSTEHATRLSPRVWLYRAGGGAPDVPEGGVALATLPTDAFGDGSHPTTRLMAGALDLLGRQHHPRSVLDVGTGTGVLARIARARGSSFVVATDIDPVALESARAHAALDRHPVEVTVSSAPPDHWGPRFELVAANILEGPLRELAPAIARAVVSGGRVLLSGFTPVQVPAIRERYAAEGFGEFVEAGLEGWCLLLMRRLDCR